MNERRAERQHQREMPEFDDHKPAPAGCVSVAETMAQIVAEYEAAVERLRASLG